MISAERIQKRQSLVQKISRVHPETSEHPQGRAVAVTKEFTWKKMLKGLSVGIGRKIMELTSTFRQALHYF